MILENKTWRAQWIHGELKMLGNDVSERGVLRWMRKAPKGTEPTKRRAAFLVNHREPLTAMDFLPHRRSPSVSSTVSSSSPTTAGAFFIAM